MGKIVYEDSGIYCDNKRLTTEITRDNSSITNNQTTPNWSNDEDSDYYHDICNTTKPSCTEVRCKRSLTPQTFVTKKVKTNKTMNPSEKTQLKIFSKTT